MAQGSEIASAYVTITTKMPGVQKDINKTLGGVDTSSAGRSMGDKLAGGMKTALKAGGIAVGAILGTALVKGFGRLKAIENAQAKLKGLGNDAKTVDVIMGNALASVKGTAFGLEEAATTAAGAVAAGIKPGEQLEDVLKGVANVSAATGRTMEETGAIFNNVAANQAAYTQDIKQLAGAGLPIWDKLQEVTGKTQKEVRKMATEGKIDFEMFAEASALAAGTVADEMGNTTTGSFDNMMAALGRLGAKILEDIFPLIGPLFQDITAWLDTAVEHVEPFIKAVGERLKSGLESVKTGWQWMKDNSAWITPIAVALGAAAAAVGLWFGAIKIWTTVTNIAKGAQLAFNIVMNANPIMLIVTAVAALVAGLVYFFTQTEIGQEIWAKFTNFLGEAWENISNFFVTAWEDYIKPVFDKIAEVVTWIWENILQPIIGFIIAYVQAWIDIILWLWDKAIKPAFDQIGKVFKWIWDKIIKPIVDFIVAYIKTWIDIIMWLWEKAIKPALDAIGKAMEWVWDKILKPVITAIWEALKTLGGWFEWLYNNVVKPVWDWISDKIKKVWENGIKPVIDTLVKIIKSDPKEAFEAARDAIGKAWDGIKELAKKPVKFVIETVINGMIGTLNKIPGVNLNKINLPPGFYRGGHTGNLPDTAVAGVVHGDEHVIRAASRRSFEARHPGLLDHINAYGRLPGYKKGGWVHPMPGAAITTLMHGYPGHMGIDLAMPQGTPIQAAAAGAVSRSQWWSGYGNMVSLDHGDGLETRYAHMLAPLHVAVGQMVKAGQVLGLEGSTGNSTGPHLHYEVLKNGRNLDPLPYLTGAGSVKPLFGIVEGLMDWAVDKVGGAFPDAGMWVETGAGVMKETVKKMIDWATGKLSIGGSTLYDNGGWLQPGLTLAENRSGRPEPILTARQWETMQSVADGSGMPKRMRLVVRDREFDAFIEEVADSSFTRNAGPVSSGSLNMSLGV